MLHGAWALLERSLRFDARNWWTHAIRLAAMAAAYCAVVTASQSGVWFGAPGLRFFQNLVIMNALLIAAAGIGFFASVITEEKEEGTLGLMLMTGLSPLGILLGKTGSRLVQAMFLVLLQIPFALLGVTLGGVTPHQVLSVYAALLSLLILVANAALLCSVLARNTRAASFRMVLVTAGYCLSAWLFNELSRWLGRSAWRGSGTVMTPDQQRLDWFARLFNTAWECTAFARIETILRTGSTFPLLGGHEIANLSVAAICFALAWGAFGCATRQPDTEPLARGFLGVRIGRRWWFAPGRVWPVQKHVQWPGAMEWKEFYYLLGGWPMLGLRIAGYFALWSFIWWYWTIWEGRSTWSTGRVVEMAVPLFSLLLALEAAVLASRMFSDEVRGQTWSTLALLPVSLNEVAYRKAATALVGLLPVLGGLGWMLLVTHEGRRGLWNVLDEAMFWGICALFVTIVHFAAWYSLYVRWGAIPLAGVTVIGPFALFVMFVEATRMGRGVDEDTIGAFLCIVCTGVCVGLHLAIGYRLSELASR